MSPHTPAQPCQSAPRESLGEEQWVAKTKVTCAKWRPAQSPASHLAQTPETSLPLPCDRLTPEGHESFPQILAPGPDKEPAPRLTIPGLGSFVGAPDAQPTRAPPGTLTCRELALGRPQKRPRGEEQERHKSRQYRRRRRRRIHVEFGRSFKQLCKELQGDGCEIHDGAASWASQAQGGECTAARQHFFLLRRNQTTSGAKASPAPPAGRSRSSPCSAEAAPVSQELLCSGRDGGGA